MLHRTRTLVLAALALVAGATAALAQSDILLRLRSGSPPGDRFRVDSAGGVVALGTLGVGIIPATGCGFRMMWYPFKASFRAGSPGSCPTVSTQWDDANTGFYSWAGGNQSQASAFATFAFGDQVVVSGTDAAGFGGSNQVAGTAGFTAGASNHVCGFGSVAIGFTNTTGTITSGNCAAGNGQGAVAIGYRVTADADYAVALGHRASADGHSGVFVAGDESTTDSIEAVANNEFATRYAGGYRFRTNATLTTGCNLPAGSGVFSCSSSRMLKENFTSVDGEELLARFRGVPVNTWSYIGERGGVRHMGPFAEDFRAAFGLGMDDKSIGLLDIDGVNFAAVKALEARTAQLQARQAEVGRLQSRVTSLESRVQELEALVRQLAASRQ
ncbi:MAG TPA: tail fiber domain-containing protein [Longimicrobium sp.]